NPNGQSNFLSCNNISSGTPVTNWDQIWKAVNNNQYNDQPTCSGSLYKRLTTTHAPAQPAIALEPQFLPESTPSTTQTCPIGTSVTPPNCPSQ
ncbi:MAG TPA: hypothetical protein VMR34_03690, partial [Candidatus Saccharimonadales bacterium]|nr:hypothetical protein [Candidatus Saccharimonadales bacterium]